ncbi:hypothetical protein CWB96_06110 [Pseudoalteromonas citrea]|uniref:Uncharacterized protein n=2 Tax=Pseudoalteromonas citrea TaxID=43655 RepID=A0A5S3XTZ8_9GAMM|nr:hypothetical protein CWB97_06555 [Pseudoalteromonas citrea]TMP60765.1 hypothetical protein CWB96_06110 [Pseudoalteromonas citrea]
MKSMRKLLLSSWLVYLTAGYCLLHQVEGNTAAEVNTQLAHKYISGVISNDQPGISGLDNPRQLSVSEDGKRVFVVSGDDNALSIFARKKGGQLQFKQTFKNIDNPEFKLEGASGVIGFNNDELLVTTSFYDGAVSLFKKVDSGAYQFVHALSDNLTPHRVFKDPSPIGELDKLNVLGAWGLIKLDQQRFAVASYQSDAVSFFQIKNEQLLLDKAANDAVKGHRFSRPVAIQSLGDQTTLNGLLVLGHEEAMLSVLHSEPSTRYRIAQVLNLKQYGCISPQALHRVTIANLVYVACTGSDHILVLSDLGREAGNKRLKVLQVLQAPSLKGLSSLVFTPDGKKGYGAAESGRGIVVLSTGQTGHLEVNKTVLKTALFAISSLTLLNTNTLIVTAALQDSIITLDVSSLK